MAEGLTQSGCRSRKSAGLIDYLCGAVYLKGAGSPPRKSFQTDNEMKCVRIAFLEAVLLLILSTFFPSIGDEFLSHSSLTKMDSEEERGLI